MYQYPEGSSARFYEIEFISGKKGLVAEVSIPRRVERSFLRKRIPVKEIKNKMGINTPKGRALVSTEENSRKGNKK